MSNYLKSAISKIYGEDDDFILLGLTGQTGSGCSTVARILSSEKSKIKHSLFSGSCPSSNEKRKELIVGKFFESNWEAYRVLQVRSIITLTLVDCGIHDAIIYLKGKSIVDDKALDLLREKLEEIKQEKDSTVSLSDFYTIRLPELSDQIRPILGETSFVSMYQTIGTNIRMSGSPIEEGIQEGKFFTLAGEINDIALKIRDEDKKFGRKTLLVIDAIRNPLEAIYFQERWASFYLVAVSCSDEDRRRRLRKLGYNESDVDKLDKQEYVRRKLEDKESYFIQDIQSCLERSDLYISNPNENNSVSEFRTLASQVIKFASLMKRPGLITPTAIERCMQIAYTAKLNSGCISRQVGAVVTDSNFSIHSVGWNDTPHGQVPCNLRNRFNLLQGKDQLAYSEFEKNNNEYLEFFRGKSDRYAEIENEGRNVSYCFKSEYNEFKGEKNNQVNTRSLHAEENAFLQISKYGGMGVEGGNLFTTASPCVLCSKKAYQLGIKNIYYIDPYPDIATSHILQGGANNPNLILFSGAIGRAFHYLYTPIVAYKDELNTLVCD
ncbi:deoxycytidylate deaminase [Methylomonas sp. 11b]|uniref:deoxycytidylate deaminase n=1 Tax=Methylomonas sp. 11b TaxID=1168169 RepID=UPI00047C353C|nr:deoxycytidylate deaminase [Methylomonas sp. 11b]